MKDAFKYCAEQKEIETSEIEREKVARETQAEDERRAAQEAERREAAKREAAKQTLVERYGSVELGNAINSVKKRAYAALSLGKMIVLAVFLVAGGFTVGYSVRLVGEGASVFSLGSPFSLIVDAIIGATIAAIPGGLDGAVVGAALFPGFVIYQYSKITARRQAASFRLQELYDEARRLREKNAA